MTVSSQMLNKKWVRRGQLAKELGIPIPTVKYYTILGFFPVPKKTEHGQHLYDLQDIRVRYTHIKELKEKRLTMQEIKDHLAMEIVP